MTEPYSSLRDEQTHTQTHKFIVAEEATSILSRIKYYMKKWINKYINKSLVILEISSIFDYKSAVE